MENIIRGVETIVEANYKSTFMDVPTIHIAQ